MEKRMRKVAGIEGEAHCNSAFSIAPHQKSSREFYSGLASRCDRYYSDEEWIVSYCTFDKD